MPLGENMPTTSSIHFVRERVLSRKLIVERTPREQAEQAQEQYLEALSLRHSKRTGLPLESARRCIEAVAISARKRHESPLA
jgi:hypothetical protein